MRHDPPRVSSTRRPARHGGTLRIGLLLGLAAALGLLLPDALLANQVYKACGKKWVKQLKKLEPAQLEWLGEQRSAKLEYDLDGDGRLDHVTLTNTPSFRDCDLKKAWSRKEITVRLDYGDGKTQVFFWIGEEVVEKMKFFPEMGRLLLVGNDPQGQPVSKWVEIRKPSGDGDTWLAGGPEIAPDAEPVAARQK